VYGGWGSEIKEKKKNYDEESNGNIIKLDGVLDIRIRDGLWRR
jgi:hypothetical protein